MLITLTALSWCSETLYCDSRNKAECSTWIKHMKTLLHSMLVPLPSIYLQTSRTEPPPPTPCRITWVSSTTVQPCSHLAALNLICPIQIVFRCFKKSKQEKLNRIPLLCLLSQWSGHSNQILRILKVHKLSLSKRLTVQWSPSWLQHRMCVCGGEVQNCTFDNTRTWIEGLFFPSSPLSILWSIPSNVKNSFDRDDLKWR